LRGHIAFLLPANQFNKKKKSILAYARYMSHKKSSLYSLVFTIFNDSVGWSVVLTIFAPLLMSPDSDFLPPGTSLHAQNIILGLLIACYPFTQFIFMPFVGALSDHFGRKKILEWTVLCATITFALSALAISWKSLSLLFISRILEGVFSANAATAQAAIADTSSERDKGKNLALSGIAGGVAWIVGPPLGGLLSSDTYFSWTGFATPFWATAFLFLINYIWVRKSFIETRDTSSRAHHDWKQEIKDLSTLIKIPQMSLWLAITTLFYLGWNFWILFYTPLLVQVFHLNQVMIGFLSGYISLFWLLCSTALNRGLAERFTPRTFILIGLPICGICALMLAFATNLEWWYALLPFFGLAGAAVWTNFLALLSNLSGRENQGKVFGIVQSLLALTAFITPVISGPLASVGEGLPLAIGGLLLLITAGLTALFSKRQGKGNS
jgi:DHA1 family tetracycline resistance protein-like MFS transporter